MEALRSYLENMFANLPNTPEVQRAKSELFQMMEDKYTSLIEEGKKENEAVGIVISEFGNLSEIADTLGIQNFVGQSFNVNRRRVSHEEAHQYVLDRSRHSFMIGLGVLLCILSPITAMISDVIAPGNLGDVIGISTFFGLIAAAIAIFIYSGSKMKMWDFLKKVPCSIDYQTADELYKEQKLNQSTKTAHLIIGILLCMLWLIPMAILDVLPAGSFITEALAPSIMFIMVGIGVMLIIFSSGKDSAYTTLLSLNDKNTVSGNYESTGSGSVTYSNETVATIMSVYWPTVRCIYLIWSFLTFDWYKTWIIWPLAIIIHKVIKANYSMEAKKI
ncbi:hypothetical protein SAMN06296386_11440 [Lachnospiraceae bacterium]|nr:hypothetical protein SAMN06296386_11440 [Lachnospiraceae bacterium]